MMKQKVVCIVNPVKKLRRRTATLLGVRIFDSDIQKHGKCHGHSAVAEA